MSIVVYDALNTAIYKVLAQHPSADPSLDYYLLALWKLGCSYRDQPTIPAQEFVEILAQAFVTEAPVKVERFDLDPESEFANWQGIILGFARDFAEVKHLPQDDPFSFHGWMNTQPSNYLERGAECVFSDQSVDVVDWQDFANLIYWGKYYE